MAINETQVMQAVYDLLFASVTTTPPGAPAPTGFENAVITVENPGRPIRVADYHKAWSPGSKISDALATKRFAMLVDPAPAFAEQYQPNGHSISSLYQQVLGAQFATQQPTAIDRQAYDDAEKFLFREVTVTDEETRKKITKQVDSAIYRNYKQAKADYAKALATYHAHYLEFMKTAAGRQKWPLIGTTFRTPVDIAWNQLQAAEANRVEDALAALEQAGDQQLARVFKDANQQFLGYQRPDPTNPNQAFATSYALPSNWTDLSQAWAQVSIMSEATQTQVDRTGTSADLASTAPDREGSHEDSLWVIRQDQSEERYALDSTTRSLSIQFEYSLVVIERPWLRVDLLGLPGWSIKNLAPGAFSSGSKTDQHTRLLPLIPQSFVVIRNLQIKAAWGKQDLERIQQVMSNSATTAFGSFLLSCSSTQTNRFESHFEHDTLSTPNPQILGWINTITPFSPPSKA